MLGSSAVPSNPARGPIGAGATESALEIASPFYLLHVASFLSLFNHTGGCFLSHGMLGFASFLGG